MGVNEDTVGSGAIHTVEGEESGERLIGGVEFEDAAVSRAAGGGDAEDVVIGIDDEGAGFVIADAINAGELDDLGCVGGNFEKDSGGLGCAGCETEEVAVGIGDEVGGG